MDYDDAEVRLRTRREKLFQREERLTRTGIPRKYWNLTWEDFEKRDATADMRDWLVGYEETFDEAMHDGRGYALLGPPGVGKTMSSCILGVLLSDAGAVVRFVPLARLIEKRIRQFTLMKLYERAGDEGALEEWSEIDRWLYTLRNVAHLVILDDVGKEHRTATGYAEDTFDQFLRERVALGRPVGITSNVKLDKWAAQYSDSMGDFLHEAGEVIHIQKRDSMRRRSGDDE